MGTAAATKIYDIRDMVLRGDALERNDAEMLSRVTGPDLWDLISAAGRVREQFRGNAVDICSIVNAKSGACSEDCAYCAQSVHHETGAKVYPLLPGETIEAAAKSAKNNGAKRFCIVTSGRGIESESDLRNIARGVELVRAAGLSPCATLGTLTKDQLAYLKHAGLERFHHNIETSRGYFPRICTTHSYDERIRVLEEARSVGLSLCSGGILGMGESWNDRIDMAYALRELAVDSVPVNFLMPITGTPLEQARPITPLEALQAIALFRMVLPNKEIRICGGRASTLRQLHPLIFAAGADGFLIGNYLTTSGPSPADDLAVLVDLGLTH